MEEVPFTASRHGKPGVSVHPCLDNASGITWSFPGLYWTSKEKSRIVRNHRHRREFRPVEVMSAFRALWSVTL